MHNVTSVPLRWKSRQKAVKGWCSSQRDQRQGGDKDQPDVLQTSTIAISSRTQLKKPKPVQELLILQSLPYSTVMEITRGQMVQMYIA